MRTNEYCRSLRVAERLEASLIKKLDRYAFWHYRDPLPPREFYTYFVRHPMPKCIDENDWIYIYAPTTREAAAPRRQGMKIRSIRDDPELHMLAFLRCESLLPFAFMASGVTSAYMTPLTYMWTMNNCISATKYYASLACTLGRFYEKTSEAGCFSRYFAHGTA